MDKMVTLICEHDGHEWKRKSQRGRKPRFCPEHKPAVVPRKTSDIPKVDLNADGTETLTCSEGHEWTRVPKRGRKPTICPEHAKKAAEEGKAKPVSKAKHFISRDDLMIYAFLNDNELDSIIYCDEQLTNGERDQADVAGIQASRQDWMRRGRRRFEGTSDSEQQTRMSSLYTRLAARRRWRGWDPYPDMYKERTA